MKAPHPEITVRLDIWLDVACLYRTRSEAQKACLGGKVAVNGQSCKPHRPVRIGDELLLSRPFGRKQTITVLGVADRHVPKADARLLYRDTTRRYQKRRRTCAASSGCTAPACSARTPPTSGNAARCAS